jgi:prevent-host-death family protein
VPITTLSSREFNQATSRAKKAAKRGPVFITDRGRPAHVLLTVKEYEKITNKRTNILDLLAMPEVAEIEIEFPRMGDEFPGAVDLS